jgi:hypothetical protein
MRNYMRKALAALAAMAAAIVMVVVPAGSAVASTTQLSGVASFAEECDGQVSDITLVIEGDLTGCLYTSVETGVQMPSGVYIETGTEVFVGCMNTDAVDACGSFTTTYRFLAKFASNGEQIFGRCQHPIVSGSGTGDFEGATGRLDFKDNVETGEALYRGHIKLP